MLGWNNLWVAATCFASALMLTMVSNVVASGITLEIPTTYNTGAGSSYICSLYAAGLHVAATVASGNDVSYSATTSYLYTVGDKPNLVFAVNSFASSGAVAVFGFSGTYAMYLIFYLIGYVEDVIMFGPFSESPHSGSIQFTGYYPCVKWTMPLDGAQSLALLYYLAQRPFFAKNQLALIQNSITGQNYIGVGDTAGALFKLEMPKLGVTNYQTAYAYALSVPSNTGVVYMFGQLIGASYSLTTPNPVTANWIQCLVSDSTLYLTNGTVATTFYLQYAMMQEYQQQLSPFKWMLAPQNVISSAPTPGVDSTDYRATQDFLTQTSSIPGCSQNACMNYAFAGWLSATALMSALRMYSGSQTPITHVDFYNNLNAAQSSFLVSDLFIGSFGPPSTSCSSAAESQGAVCHCNQAAINIFFTQLKVSGNTVDVATIPGASFQYAKDKCASVVSPGEGSSVTTPYTELFTFSIAKQLVGLRPYDSAMMTDMCYTVSAVSTVLSNRVLYQHLAPNGYSVGCISARLASVSTALAAHVSSYVTTSMTGVIPDSMIGSIATPSTFVLDFMPQTTQPHVMLSNLVYLFPTLDQELYVLASYLHAIVSASSVVCCVVRTSSASSAIVKLMTKTLTTFQLTVASDHMVQTSGTLGSSIPSACTHTFMVGLDEDDADGITAYLHSHTSAVALLSFDDVTKYYSSLQTTFGGQVSSLTDRLVFATNLPSWTATPSNPTAAAASAPLSTVSQFLQSVPDSLHTPAALRAFIVAMMYDMLSAGHGPNPDVQQLLYAAVTVFLDGVMYGPFTTECATLAVPMSPCVGNAGATGIAVWSYTRVVAPSTPLLVLGAFPSMGFYVPSAPAVVVEEGSREEANADASTESVCVHWVDSSVLIESSNSSSFSSSNRSSAPISVTPSSLLSSSVSGSRKFFPVAINDLLMILSSAVIVVAFIIVLLLLWRYNALHSLWEAFQRCVCLCKRTEMSSPMEDELQKQTTDASRWVAASVAGRTTVVVELEHWRTLWVRVPELMRCVAEYYQWCVRGAILRHGCVELRTVAGLFVVLCPSAISSVVLVEDIHRGLSSMRSSLCDALLCAYRSFSVVPNDNDPHCLCVRVGIHTNHGESNTAVPALWCAESVEIATRAAYRSGSRQKGLAVMTERTRSAFSEEQLESMHASLQSVGLHALRCCSDELVFELFVLSSCSSSTPIAMSTSPTSERMCDYSVRMLLSGTETGAENVSHALCATTIRAFYGSLPLYRVVLLERLQELLLLPPVDKSADESGYADTLITAVSCRLAALLECRYGFLPGVLDALHAKKREGSSEGDTSHGERSSIYEGKCNDQSRRSHSKRVFLRRFAYGAEDIADGSEARVEQSE